jgi:hypothetical protein
MYLACTHVIMFYLLDIYYVEVWCPNTPLHVVVRKSLAQHSLNTIPQIIYPTDWDNRNTACPKVSCYSISIQILTQ